MARAKCLIAIDGRVVITSQQTGKRYTFTRQTRIVEIDDCDVKQFDTKGLRVSSKGCCGGKGVQDMVIKVFQILN